MYKNRDCEVLVEKKGSREKRVTRENRETRDQREGMANLEYQSVGSKIEVLFLTTI